MTQWRELARLDGVAQAALVARGRCERRSSSTPAPSGSPRSIR